MQDIKDISEYLGRFAILRDFYRPDGMGSGVMAWDGDDPPLFWDMWCAAGKPEVQGGDQAWIERCCEAHGIKAHRWQDLYPGAFESYKCLRGWPNGQTKVVCFHGFPKNHDVDDDWVKLVWRKGGPNARNWKSLCNTAKRELELQISINMKRDLPWAEPRAATQRHVVLVGGGPSLGDTWEKIRSRKRRGQYVVTMNNTHDFLIGKGIVPDAYLMLDARQHNVEFVRNPHKDVTYFIASQCHPDVFEALEGYDVRVWHASNGVDDHLKFIAQTEYPGKPFGIIGGGNTIGLRAMFFFLVRGHGAFHLYGYDSCYRDGENHAYRQAVNDGERVKELYANGRKFICAPWMIKQAQDFQNHWRTMVTQHDCLITTHGDGLIQHINKILYEQLKEAA